MKWKLKLNLRRKWSDETKKRRWNYLYDNFFDTLADKCDKTTKKWKKKGESNFRLFFLDFFRSFATFDVDKFKAHQFLKFNRIKMKRIIGNNLEYFLMRLCVSIILVLWSNSLCLCWKSWIWLWHTNQQKKKCKKMMIFFSSFFDHRKQWNFPFSLICSLHKMHQIN